MKHKYDIIEKGVYMDRSRVTAVVLASRDHDVAFVSMEDSPIEVRNMKVRSFLERFTVFLPMYGARRAAQRYLSSPLPKTTKAVTALRRLASRA